MAHNSKFAFIMTVLAVQLTTTVYYAQGANAWNPCGDCSLQQYCDTGMREEGECRLCLEDPCNPHNMNYKEDCSKRCPYVWESIQRTKAHETSTTDIPSGEEGHKWMSEQIYVVLGVVGIILLVIIICLCIIYLRNCPWQSSGSDQKERVPLKENNVSDSELNRDVKNTALDKVAVQMPMVHSGGDTPTTTDQLEPESDTEQDAGQDDVVRSRNDSMDVRGAHAMPTAGPAEHDRMLPGGEYSYPLAVSPYTVKRPPSFHEITSFRTNNFTEYDFISDGPGEILSEAQPVSPDQARSPARLVMTGKEDFSIDFSKCFPVTP